MMDLLFCTSDDLDRTPVGGGRGGLCRGDRLGGWAETGQEELIKQVGLCQGGCWLSQTGVKNRLESFVDWGTSYGQPTRNLWGMRYYWEV